MAGEPRRIIYLNNAATTWPKPPEVMEEVHRSLSLPFFEEGRSTLAGQRDYPRETRNLLAEFFRAGPPEHFVFTQNATDSLNMAIHGFLHQLGERCHVITTELDHNSVLRPLRTLEREGRISLTVVPFDGAGYVSPGSVREAVREDTRLAVITHGSNVLGTVQDIGEIGDLLRSRGIFFVVDGAQTAGQVPVDLGSLPLDVYAFTGHKALFGMPGIGGFFIRDPALMDPVRQGGTGANSGYPFQEEGMPERFEAGTHNYPGIASLSGGIRFLRERGIGNVERETMAMTRFLIHRLKETGSIAIDNENPDLPIVSFTISGMEPEKVGFILARIYGIICRTGLHCAPLVHRRINGGRGSVRLSLSCMNTLEECEQVADALAEVARGAC
ncbi:MAG: aminotransferase class V-fold PLP-dependent enzyme [Methanomicrobiales archaeon]|nr:aminotransferase class V-fold PLP-dependent enzyme [Methanomicrobiales archaeon]MDD1669084.1 aminotransferase class V-fold PLP-dependent enzyme [Methanomicrobiales archaeon]